MSERESVGIIGLGQIGGSIALALADHFDIHFLARSDKTRFAGVSAGFTAIDSFSSLAERCRVIFVAVPVDKFPEVISELVPFLCSGHVVSDVSSTKSSIMKLISNTIMPKGACFIGGHPMAGNAISGFSGADRGLFTGATWVLTPSVFSNDVFEGVLLLTSLITSRFNANVALLDYETHDKMVAKASHLEHLIGLALVEMAQRAVDGSVLERFIAGSFRSATRVVQSEASMVVPFLTDSKYLDDAINEFSQLLDELRDALGDRSLLDSRWSSSSHWRRSIDNSQTKLESITIRRDLSGLRLLQELGMTGRLVSDIEFEERTITLTVKDY